ncbi:hypothetical protein GUJ93_ZPchr0012g19078 [Zizania palustris]|uniref:DUF4378 domain-containing protein n=1 Tax=Zizania palustris TaxID=103762 RepID=A0A8J6BQR4_ZIZPA|nr:hypothetical protein GUJ93_ZPchr0012g19078 [Zizania palustris]
MASLLSPSPSPSSGGNSSTGGACRLSELLEEQQEPFSLEVFLLDKGCSPALLDGAGTACWPRSGGVARALTRRRQPGADKNIRASGLPLLRIILSKIFRGTMAAKKVRKRQLPAAIDWGGGRRRLGNSNNGARSSPFPRCLDGAVEADMEEDDDDDDESSKQLSPVSVLEHGLFEQASPAYSQRAIVIFRELLAAAYTPALPDHPHPVKHSSSTTATTANAPAPAPSTSASRTTISATAAASRWEETLEAELARVHDIVASEMTAACWSVYPIGDARRHVGAELAAAVLEALTEEVATELLPMRMDDGHGVTMRGVVGADDVDICLLKF